MGMRGSAGGGAARQESELVEVLHERSACRSVLIPACEEIDHDLTRARDLPQAGNRLSVAWIVQGQVASRPFQRDCTGSIGPWRAPDNRRLGVGPIVGSDSDRACRGLAASPALLLEATQLGLGQDEAEGRPPVRSGRPFEPRARTGLVALNQKPVPGAV